MGDPADTFEADAGAVAIGIDLGGTEIKAAAMRLADGECLARKTEATRDGEREGEEPLFVRTVKRLVDALEEQSGSPASRVGVAAPGLANREASAIAFMPGRLHGLENLVWADVLERPGVTVLNDAHAALMGEIWLGTAEGMKDVVMLTLGTGVGGAIVSGGRLLTGRAGRAGHWGHATVDGEGEPDICGTPGSIEDAIGTATLKKRSGGRFETTDSLLDAVAAGDAEAERIWLTSVRALAAGLVSIVNTLDPEAIVLGGGLTAAGSRLFDPLQTYLDLWEWRPGGLRVSVRQARLGVWAGAYGAAYRACLIGG